MFNGIGSIIKGDPPAEVVAMASEAPRAWWDDRDNTNANVLPPPPPEKLDTTDLDLINRKYGVE